MPEKETKPTLDFEKLKLNLQPPPRGLLAGPLSDGEERQRQFQANRAGLVDAMHIIIETMPYVHPDFVMGEVEKLNDPDLATITRLQLIQMTLKSVGRLAQLQEAVIKSEAKNATDQGIEVPAEEEFTLNTVLETMANRVGQPTRPRV